VRILHFADLHLGVENYSHLDPATGLSSCFGDFLATLDETKNLTLEEIQRRVDKEYTKIKEMAA